MGMETLNLGLRWRIGSGEKVQIFFRTLGFLGLDLSNLLLARPNYNVENWITCCYVTLVGAGMKK